MDHQQFINACVICRQQFLIDEPPYVVGRGIATLTKFSAKYDDVELNRNLMSQPAQV
jgi:hypothetical protein